MAVVDQVGTDRQCYRSPQPFRLHEQGRCNGSFALPCVAHSDTGLIRLPQRRPRVRGVENLAELTCQTQANRQVHHDRYHLLPGGQVRLIILEVDDMDEAVDQFALLLHDFIRPCILLHEIQHR